MRGFSRQSLSRIENLMILLLACSALVLFSRTTLVQGNARMGGSPESVEAARTMSLSRCAPVAVVHAENGKRTGALQDGSARQLWQEGELDGFLNQVLAASEPPASVTAAEWQNAILRGDNWLWFDFLYDVPFSDDSESGFGRRFLVLLSGNRPTELYYYCEKSGQYYTCQLSGILPTLPDLHWPRHSGSIVFAFEEPETAAILPDQVLTDETPDCPNYSVTSALADLDWAMQSELLEELDFNLRTISIYQSSAGPVFRDGEDTLRVQSDGTVSFHTSETKTGRYCALSNRVCDLQRTAESVLDPIFAAWGGTAEMYCAKRETNEDGSVTLFYQYRIGDTEALLSGNGAEFTFRDCVLVNFEGHFVNFTETDEVPAILPIRQAAAVSAATGQVGHELRLCYQVQNGIMQAGWVLRMEEE